MRDLSYAELLQLVELIESSTRFREVRFRCGDVELELRRGARDAARMTTDSVPAPPGNDAPRPTSTTAPDAATTAVPASGATASSATGTPTRAAAPAGATLIRSPMVGTFYRAPEPGAKPFVEIGSAVEPSTTVCIIEVMKLMNSIPAGCRGRVVAILVADGDALEYGQPVIAIAADAA